ncbi:hypothetical protein M9458_027564, partial [Cirrhinus mrigala]
VAQIGQTLAWNSQSPDTIRRKASVFPPVLQLERDASHRRNDRYDSRVSRREA